MGTVEAEQDREGNSAWALCSVDSGRGSSLGSSAACSRFSASERASERVECRSRSIAALLGPSIQYGILPLPMPPPPLVSYPILSALICMCNASPFLSAVAAVTMVAAISMGVAR